MRALALLLALGCSDPPTPIERCAAMCEEEDMVLVEFCRSWPEAPICRCEGDRVTWSFLLPKVID